MLVEKKILETPDLRQKGVKDHFPLHNNTSHIHY